MKRSFNRNRKRRKPGKPARVQEPPRPQATVTAKDFAQISQVQAWSRQEAQAFIEGFRKAEDCPHTQVPKEPGNLCTCAGGTIAGSTLRQCHQFKNCIVYNLLLEKQVAETNRTLTGQKAESSSNHETCQNTDKACQTKTKNSESNQQSGPVDDVKIPDSDAVMTISVKNLALINPLNDADIYYKNSKGNYKNLISDIAKTALDTVDGELVVLKAIVSELLSGMYDAPTGEDTAAMIKDRAERKIMEAIKTIAFVQDKKYQILERAKGMIPINSANHWIKEIMREAFSFIPQARRHEFTAAVKERLMIKI